MYPTMGVLHEMKLHTIHKAKVYSSFERTEQGVRNYDKFGLKWTNEFKVLGISYKTMRMSK